MSNAPQSSKPNTRHLTQRLDRLEAANHRWRAACVTIGLALLASVTFGQANPKALPAQKIDGRLVVDELVVQEDGRDRIMMIARNGNTMVAQMDERGEPVLILGTSKGVGPWISMRDRNGHPRIAANVSDDGATLTHADAAGRDRITTATVGGTAAYTTWNDIRGKARIAAATRAGQSTLNVADDRGRPRVLISATDAGSTIAQQDSGGRIRAATSVEENQVIRIIYDELGRQRLKSVQLGAGDATTYFTRPDAKGGLTLLKKLP